MTIKRNEMVLSGEPVLELTYEDGSDQRDYQRTAYITSSRYDIGDLRGFVDEAGLNYLDNVIELYQELRKEVAKRVYPKAVPSPLLLDETPTDLDPDSIRGNSPDTLANKPCPNCGGNRVAGPIVKIGKPSFYHCWDCGANITPPENSDAPNWFGGTFQVPVAWEHSSDEERESPDTEELPNSVRAIVKNIHTAAQQSRRTASASARTLLYIDLKTKEGIQIPTRDRHLKSTLYHIKAMIISTNTAEQKIIRIEQIAATALNLPFQEVQS